MGTCFCRARCTADERKSLISASEGSMEKLIVDESLKSQTESRLLFWKPYANPQEWKFSLPNFWNILKWVFGCYGRKARLPNEETLKKDLPVQLHPTSALLEAPSHGIQVTWIGHASLLVQFDGLAILTDPVFSDYAGLSQIPFLGSLVGFKRYRPAPFSVDALPGIDVVLISHNHYDHLDVNSVKQLNQKFPDIKWLVPKNMKKWFDKHGCKNVIEFNWWEKCKLQGISDTQFIFAPAQHWSSRSGFDKCLTLWGSWIVQGPTKRFFFAGDTGYNAKLFKEIGKHGPYDLAAIPIGACRPRKIMKPQHIEPKEAVLIHQEIKAKKSVGIHWGTFHLSNEAYDFPPAELKTQLENVDLLPEDFFTMRHGEVKIIDDEEQE